MPPMQLLDRESTKSSSAGEWWERRTNLERRLVLISSCLSVFIFALIITVAVLASQNSRNVDNPSSTSQYFQSEKILHSTHSPKQSTTTEVLTTPISLPSESTMLPSTTVEESNNIYKIRQDFCSSEGCIAAAYSLFSSIDHTVHPCDDFYQHACGKWILDNVLPNSTESIMQNMALHHRLILTKDVLNQQVAESEHIYKSNVLNFYKACMDLSAIEELGSKPLIDFIKQYSAWTFENLWNPEKFNWVYAVAELDFDVLMWLDIRPDYEKLTKNIIYLEPGSLGDFWNPEEYLHSLSQNIEHARAYMDFMTDIAKALGANSSNLITDLKNIALFEAKIANITLKSDGTHIRDIPAYNRTTVKELISLIPDIDWLGFFGKNFHKSLTIPETEEILVNHFEYYPALIKIINETNMISPKILPNYILLRVTMMYAFDLSSEFQEAFIKFKQHVTSVIIERKRWNFCLDLTITEFPNTIGALFVEKYFPKKAFYLSNQIYQNVSAVYKQVIEKSSWLDETTKNNIIKKLNSIDEHSVIGYIPSAIDEEYLQNVHKDISIMDPQTHFKNRVNLRHNDRDVLLNSLHTDVTSNIIKGGAADPDPNYSTEENGLYIYAGALQRPKFDMNFPKSFNFAGIGSKMANLMTLAINSIDHDYNSQEEKVVWGLNATLEKYNEKADCFIEQFNKYHIPELGQNVNGTRTQKSNIGETVGLKIAYKAFMEAIKTNGDDFPLPGLTGYSSEQLFFFNFAQMFCGGSNIYTQLKSLFMEESPDIHRVNGVLSNLPEFSEAFHCSSNSKMNPEEKCNIWE